MQQSDNNLPLGDRATKITLYEFLPKINIYANMTIVHVPVNTYRVKFEKTVQIKL